MVCCNTAYHIIYVSLYAHMYQFTLECRLGRILVLDVSDCLLVMKERQVVGKQTRYDRTHSLLQADVVVGTWQVYLSVQAK